MVSTSLADHIALRFLAYSLPDKILDQKTILSDLLHLFLKGRHFELLTPFVDQFKSESWAELVTLDLKVIFDPDEDGALVQCTFQFTDPQRLLFLCSDHLLLTLTIDLDQHIILFTLSHWICSSAIVPWLVLLEESRISRTISQ